MSTDYHQHGVRCGIKELESLMWCLACHCTCAAAAASKAVVQQHNCCSCAPTGHVPVLLLLLLLLLLLWQHSTRTADAAVAAEPCSGASQWYKLVSSQSLQLCSTSTSAAAAAVEAFQMLPLVLMMPAPCSSALLVVHACPNCHSSAVL
jgi:hypothetical protein